MVKIFKQSTIRCISRLRCLMKPFLISDGIYILEATKLQKLPCTPPAMIIKHMNFYASIRNARMQKCTSKIKHSL